MARRKPIYMESTEIEAFKTAAEITGELVRAGASSINTDYQDGKVSGLRWVMKIEGRDVLFDMPVRVEPIFKILQRERRSPWSYTDQDRAQAERVGWRQLLRWVQAQNAMIEVGMVKADEVYMPYMVHPVTGRTFYAMLQDSQFKLLEAPK